MTKFTTHDIFEALKSPLRVVDNAERRQQLEDYVEAARLPLERAVSDLIARFADATNAEVSAHYEVVLGYREDGLELEVRPTEPSEPTDEAWSMAEGDVEKVTLRLPAELKELATEAAAKAGLSVNSWYVRVLARALRGADQPGPAPRSRRGRHAMHERRGRGEARGQRLSGWVGGDE